ncbi:nuclear transport factor 2 family protein [Pricia sp. S334]|uniref:Nuclear transport factor 2 family protein n=1 Tax=Pricia mediterranea TaxID=3076079 RepID=A0ABU3L9A6_9FLAO|nr:nuclear transport factor 2 family protein [Pricia sp. S334]MDT7830330.1 nuclear transport factor 2 family protein [Pricia sp. S334]
MKHVLSFLLCLFIFSLSAQESEKDDVQRTIETFFEGFHQQDSMKIKQTVSDEIVMRRISTDSAGKAFVRQQDFPDFLNMIVSIPKTTQFREIIKSYSIRIDGPMAQVWTPYEFRFNGEFDHCGTNSFQLFKEDRDWKIIYIIDTGRKEGCD